MNDLGFIVIASIQQALFLVRFMFIVYFTHQTMKYLRLKSAIQKDTLTIATFILMIISTLMWCVSGSLLIVVNLVYRLHPDP